MTDILILERARNALQQQHYWHLSQTEEVILCGDITIIPADEYSESGMFEETVSALDMLNQEINRRTGKNQ